MLKYIGSSATGQFETFERTGDNLRIAFNHQHMTAVIKQAMFAVAPKWSTSFFSARARAYSQSQIASWGNDAVVKKLLLEFGNIVQSGPFMGMLLTPMTQKEQLGPYLLGTYESELSALWGVVLESRYSQIVDVGAKFGYYAIGLARRYPAAQVIAFDTDPWARKALSEMREKNGTANVSIDEFCTAEWIATHMRPDSLLISDCEGYESELFIDTSVRNLSTVTVVIETHDDAVPGVTESLAAIFRPTHDVQLFTSILPRQHPARLPDSLTENEKQLATQEVRSATQWLMCSPIPPSPNAA